MVERVWGLRERIKTYDLYFQRDFRNEKERDAYVLGIIIVLYEMFEKNEASKIVDAVIQDELIDYVL